MQQASSTTSASLASLTLLAYSYLPRKPNTPPCGRVNTLAIMRRKRDPMSSVHLPTRRTILTLGLTATTITFSGCAPSTRTIEKPSPSYPSPTQTFMLNKDKNGYDGVIRLDTYEKHGKFIPATTEHPAQNVPKPLMPDYINEYSNNGFYASIAYWVEAVNYAYLTGDLKPLSQITDARLTLNSEIIKLYEEKTGWVIGPQHPCSVEFETAGSNNNLNDPSIREWQSIIRISPETKVYNSTTGTTTPFLEFSDQKAEKKSAIGLRYSNNEWYFVNDDGSNVEKKPL